MALVSGLPKAISASFLIQKDLETISPSDAVEEVRSLVAKTLHPIPVVDTEGELAGTLASADLVARPKRKIILVDHFERSQAILGLEEAEIIEIIDHHRIGNIETMHPRSRRLPSVGQLRVHSGSQVRRGRSGAFRA